MVTQDQIVAAHQENPTWFADQIASHLSCSGQHVHVVAARRGIAIPRKPWTRQRPAKPRAPREPKTPKRTASAIQLGRACLKARLTLRDIERISQREAEHV